MLVPEHHPQLGFGHRRVRPQGRHDVHLGLRAEHLVEQAGQLPGIRVEPGMIGRQHQHLAQRTANDFQGLRQRLSLLSRADVVPCSPTCKVCRHNGLSRTGRRIASAALSTLCLRTAPIPPWKCSRHYSPFGFRVSAFGFFRPSAFGLRIYPPPSHPAERAKPPIHRDNLPRDEARALIAQQPQQRADQVFRFPEMPLRRVGGDRIAARRQ